MEELLIESLESVVKANGIFFEFVSGFAAVYSALGESETGAVLEVFLLSRCSFCLGRIMLSPLLLETLSSKSTFFLLTILPLPAP
jgi:hypothetical protein